MKDKDGNVTENYRKDGSILFSDSRIAFTRLTTNSKNKKKEDFAAVIKEGILITPDYKNTAGNCAPEMYGYTYENGDIMDKEGNVFQTLATIHTHFFGDAPPSGIYTGKGDLETLSRDTPNRPILTIGNDGYIHGVIGYYDKQNNLHWGWLPYNAQLPASSLLKIRNFLNKYVYGTYSGY